ncbi:MAG: site-2 protease family protein [Pirellulaceae bacterium]|nr:site-2 protease family protein [Pirellulaceae bacterium]
MTGSNRSNDRSPLDESSNSIHPPTSGHELSPSADELGTGGMPGRSAFDPLPGDISQQPFLTEEHLRTPQRRIRLPFILFLLTCVSTFLAGVTSWEPIYFWLQEPFALHSDPQSYAMSFRRVILRHWDQGLIYMACVLAILLAHEMGHFLATVRYRIAASLPYFIPLPIIPLGTMGAVIGMDGLRANRRELFDIGIAGPLAGLVVAIPVLWIGTLQLDWTQPESGHLVLDMPILARLMLNIAQPPGYENPGHLWPGQMVSIGLVNPYFMAGWVGLLITGLNMLPISQLDGGHVIYTLFGKRAHWIARAFLVIAIAFMVFAEVERIWTLMLVIIVLIGTDHPPTSNDQMPLGPVRFTIGMLSLLIPLLCFPPFALDGVGM